jgi:hypothetical protein
LDKPTKHLFRLVLVLDLGQRWCHTKQLGVWSPNHAGLAHLFADDVGWHIAKYALGQVSDWCDSQPGRWLSIFADVLSACLVKSTYCFADITGLHKCLAGRHDPSRASCLQISNDAWHPKGWIA